MRQANFIAFLVNVDKSILGLKLEFNFRIEELSNEEAHNIICKLEQIENRHTYSNFISRYPFLFEHDKCYCVRNSFDDAIEVNEKGFVSGYSKEYIEFNNKSVDEYLNEKIRLLRLFNEGDICIALSYYYVEYNGDYIAYLRWNNKLRKLGSRYTIQNGELEYINKMIKEIKTPFRDETLKLAFDNFELSYELENLQVSFLILMNCMETLFNPADRNEITFTISRNTAIVVGKCYDECTKVYKCMRELYKKRSEIVHTGKADKLDVNDLIVLRKYARICILNLINFGKSYKDYKNLLDTYGFNDRLV